MRADILIKNGKILDGTGQPGYMADLAIIGNRITAVGGLTEVEAAKVLDASGKIVAPGFIDIHTHNDMYMNRNNLPTLFEPYIRQGITTCVTGNCGWGIAPVAEENRQLFLNTVASLGVSFDKPVEWSTIDEFLTYVDRKGPVINMAHLVPHGALRMIAMGERNTFASPDDIRRMKALVKQGMEAGCYGFSSGLMYYPGIYSGTEELGELNSVCGEYRGRYATHLRAQCTTFPYALEEAIEIARRGGTGLQVSHFHAKPFLGNKAALFYHMAGLIERVNSVIPVPTITNKALKKGLEIADREIARGLDLGMDMVPYIMSNTTISALFPPWSHVGGTEAFLKRLADPATWAEIKKDMRTVTPEWPPWGARAWSDNYSKALGWHIIRVLSVQTDKNRPVEGMTMAELAAKRHADPWEAARQIALEESGMVTIQAGFPPNPWIEKFSSYLFRHPQMSVMSDAVLPSQGKPPQAAYGAFPRFLSRYVRELQLVPLPEAVRKITSLPAARYGMEGRGVISEGHYADIVIFDELTVRDNSSPEQPDVTPTGIDAVLINGKIVLEKGIYHADANAGRVLRKKS
jgi:N-acyl-D-amino-acid deacylase